MDTQIPAWSTPSPHLPAAQPTCGEELAMQARPMGLKVHYSFDRDNQMHCLARWPHLLQIQTIPLDEKTTIGVVDLATCLRAVAQSSPEILSQQETDYSVYAYDYSEPDVPLVGQGLLSRAMGSQHEPPQPQQQPQLVTGRVTRNLLALLNNGSRDTLEVKLKFATVPRPAQRADYTSIESANGPTSSAVPADTTSEWNSLIQSNSMMGHAGNVSAVSSPALAPAQLATLNAPMSDNRQREARSDSQPPQPIRPASIPPPNALAPALVPPANRAPSIAPSAPRPQGPAENAPSPAAPQGLDVALPPRPSRPASRSRSKQPTGRPRGRPRKKPLETGNTSAAEEATDGDDAPQKKRAKVTRTEYSVIAPFGAAPDSLRVAASTSGSLRALRPVGAGGDAPVPNHLQDIPRAPTPIPDAPLLQQQQQRRIMLDSQARLEPVTNADHSAPGRLPLQSLSQDARSPAGSVVQSPDHGYSPEDSAGDLGSSPPVPRTTAYVHSSPPASSPTLPAMPMAPLDSGFMSGGLEDFFDEEDMLQDHHQGQTQDQMLPLPSVPAVYKPTSRKNSRGQQQEEQQHQHSNFPFQEVTPGPPELLPTKSIFNPAGKAKALNRPPPATSGTGMPKKSTTRSLKRSNTAPIMAPNPVMSEGGSRPHEPPPTYEPNGNRLSEGPAQPYPFQDQTSFPDGMACITDPKQSTAASEEHGQAEIPPQQPASAPALPMPVPERPEPEPEPVLPTSNPPTSGPVSRPISSGPAGSGVPVTAVPASDAASEPVLTLPRVPVPEFSCPPSDLDPPRYSKNLVKKQSIKEKLESAIEKGESPPFCSNCGAIETPTWRKIWTQDHEGLPGFHEFSEKPGCVTMIEVLERDQDEKPCRYRVVKKNLGPKDDKKKWIETLLCNPCGIWLGKFKGHRPPDRWDKDAARLSQSRRKREPKGSNSRSKKARTKSDAQANPTSEAYFTTDPLGPPDNDSPNRNNENVMQCGHQSTVVAQDEHLNLQSSPKQRFPGSTHSRGSGTADSPIAVEDDLGSTRRLLFPSPRKDGEPKVLGELSLNTVMSGVHGQDAKSAAARKGNSNNFKPRERPGTPGPEDDLDQELFGTPPSTPPPRTSAGPFKTPTRPTPIHRPITRSISRSIRSIAKSPSQLLAPHLQRTPTKTPRSTTGLTGSRSASRRHNSTTHLHAHFAIDDHDVSMQMDMTFDSPFTATLQQLLSEANEFIGGGVAGGGSPSRGLDLSGIAQLDAADGHPGDCSSAGSGAVDATMDFGSFLSTELVMPSSPPILRGGAKEFGEVLQQQQQQQQQKQR